MKQRILVVDDDQALATSLCDILELHGWEADCAFSGEEALEKIESAPPEAVVMDIRMPGITGVEALRRLRGQHPTMRVILMTAFAASDLLDQALKARALEILEKPVRPADLMRALAQHPPLKEPVLVVDDDVLFLESLSALLELEGIPVSRAASLSEALDRLLHYQPRVVLLDMRLDPALEPADCVATIKKASPEVMFILYSGYPNLLRQAKDRIPDEWVQGCLLKPFPPPQLLELLA